METIQPAADKGLTESGMVELWLNRQRSPLTRSVYRRDIARLLDWSDKTLAETTALDLERFAEALAGSGLAPVSQGRTLAAIRSFFRFAERIGYCRNSAVGLELPRTDAALSERIIPQEDVQRMIALEPEGRNRVLLAVLYAAGLRVSEACALRWANLQPRGVAGQITVMGKRRRARVVSLPEGNVAVADRFEGRCAHGRAGIPIKVREAPADDAFCPGVNPNVIMNFSSITLATSFEYH